MNSPTIHFVISAPRSGSTWLARALNQHPEILATEHRFFGEFSETWRNNDGSYSPRITLDAYTAAFAGHYFHEALGLSRGQFINQLQRNLMGTMIRLGSTRSGKSIIVDKITPYPGTAATVRRQIEKFFPESKVIQLVRDGRDVAVSGAFDWLLKDAEGTDRHRFFVRQDPGFVLNRFFDDTVLTKWAENWRETLEIFSTERADLQITYEAMKADQASELHRFFGLLGVDDSTELAARIANDATFEKLTGRAAGQMEATAKARKAVVGDWRNYFTRADGELFQEIAGASLIECGYESDASWFETLPEQLTETQLDA